jgi:DNA-binding CsgD family transcriptional regulator
VRATGRVPDARRLRRKLSTTLGEYTITASVLDHEPSAYGVAVAVMVERSERVVFPEMLLRHRYRFTQRETEVARLLSQGATNAEVARSLAISAATARHHTESVMHKLGVSSRARIPRLLATLDRVE